MVSVTCTHCDTLFSYLPIRPGRPRKYCSDVCRRAANVKRQTALDLAHKERTGVWPRRRRMNGERLCPRCLRPFTKSAERRVFCSRTCSVGSINGPAHRSRVQRQLPVLHPNPTPITRLISEVIGTGVWTAGRCRVCGVWFTSKRMDITCGQVCRDEYHTDREADRRRAYKARKTDAFVAKVYRRKVFEADGYRCHICGRLTARRQKPPHPKAPTIDHVIPLAAGGTHEPANCRTACFICNCTKREIGGGEQMLLFG